MRFFLLLGISILFYSCNSPKNKNISFKKTLIIGHKGASKTKEGNQLTENSFEAVEYAYKKLDGIEVDIRSSKDTTFWLIHDKTINYNKKKLLFSLLSDKEIQNINYQTKDSIITLKQLFSFLAKQKKRKFVSLDMKAVDNDFWLQDPEEWFNIITDSIVSFYNYYKPNSTIAIESWNLQFLQKIEEKAENLETYLLIWNPLNENDILNAERNNIDGLSCNIEKGLDKKIIDLAKEKNIKIQTWTIRNEKTAKEILKTKPSTMQVDNTNDFINKNI